MSRPAQRRQTLAEDPRVMVELLGPSGGYGGGVASPPQQRGGGFGASRGLGAADQARRRYSVAGYLKETYGNATPQQQQAPKYGGGAAETAEEHADTFGDMENRSPSVSLTGTSFNKLRTSGVAAPVPMQMQMPTGTGTGSLAANQARLTQRRRMTIQTVVGGGGAPAGVAPALPPTGMSSSNAGGAMRQRAGSFGAPTASSRARANSLDGIEEEPATSNNASAAAPHAGPARTFATMSSSTTMVPTNAMDGFATGRSSMYVLQDRRDWSAGGMVRGVRRVIEFLATRGYGREVSEQALMSPTVALFRDVLVAMASLMDPHVAEDVLAKARTRANWETPACNFFRAAKYPFQLSPKQMNAVGSANAWPKFLGALTWLADLFDADDAVQETLASADRERWTLFEFLQSAYASYMEGDDAAIERVLSKLRVDVDRQTKEATKRLEDAVAKVGRLEAELTRLESADDVDVGTLMEKRDALKADNDKYRSVIAAWETKKRATAAKLAAAVEDKDKAEEELRQARERKAQSRALLDAQVISSEDVERILGERDRLAKACDDVVKQKQTIASRCREINEEVDTDVEALQRKVQDFNSRVRFLGEDATTAVAALEPDWRAHASGMGALLDASRAVNARQALAHVRERYLARAHEARERVLELQDSANRNRDECAEIESRISGLRAAAKRADERHRADVEALKTELEAVEAETFAMEEAMDQVRNSTRTADDLEAEIENLRFEIEEENARFSRACHEHDESVHAAMALMVELKEDVENVTAGVSAAVSEVRASADAVVVEVAAKVREVVVEAQQQPCSV